MAQTTQSVPIRIFQLLRDGQARRRREIAEALSLSMPTTLQNVTELIEANILEECGAAQSSGGRKARMLRLRREAGQVVGVNIGVRHVGFVTADLAGTLRQSSSAPLAFRDEPEWYVQFREALLGFLEENRIDPSQVLGGGVSFPGIIDGGETQVLRSHILGLSHMGLERFRKVLPFPAVFANDANCACFAERDGRRDSFVFLSLNESVGGAVILKGDLWTGESFQAGKPVICCWSPVDWNVTAEKGCADAYLSPQALERDGWDVYLDHLAILLTNLRMLLNLDLVVGGQIGARIGPHMDELLAKAAQYDHFARDVDYIYPCTQQEHACALGAAGFALEKYGVRVLPGAREEDL